MCIELTMIPLWHAVCAMLTRPAPFLPSFLCNHGVIGRACMR